MIDGPTSILEAARAAGRRLLLEHEGLALLRHWGVAVPRHRFVAGADDEAALRATADWPGVRRVVKVLSDRLPHRSEVGGVRIAEASPGALRATIAAMERSLADWNPEGFLIAEYVEHDPAPGGELLVGVRFTDDFGPVVSVSLGGLLAEFLAAELREGSGPAILTPDDVDGDGLARALSGRAAGALIAGGVRNQPARIDPRRLGERLARFAREASSVMPEGLSEIEINPLALTADGPIALDVLARIGETAPDVEPERPLERLGALLRPRSIGIVGVSRRRNPGRIILENVLREGFPRERVAIVKPGGGEIDGCRCHESLDALPERLDLLVLGIDADQVPETLERVIERRIAESVILIPGGLGEHPRSAHRVQRMRRALRAARRSDWGGPLINGGNCLGVRSRPGRYDTLFIPETKLPRPRQSPAPLALISQSGALACAKMGRLHTLDPRYVISVGNQFDLTVGDYLTRLADDAEVEVFACYVEGFRPLDGLRWLEAARRIVASGRTVILYRAGRTADGARASASHTASIAGDYAVTRELARSAGVIVTDRLAEFDDLVRLACALRGRRPAGRRLGALSNAGFECVAIGDHAGRFRLEPFSPETVARLADLLERNRLGEIVAPGNPLDVTPILGDEPFVEAARAILDDPRVDVGLVGCVPMTGALNTLAEGIDPDEDLTRPDSVASRLIALWGDAEKPFVAVVDAGPLFDPLERALASAGVPTFRTADRALRILGAYCDALERAPGQASSDLT